MKKPCLKTQKDTDHIYTIFSIILNKKTGYKLKLVIIKTLCSNKLHNDFHLIKK